MNHIITQAHTLCNTGTRGRAFRTKSYMDIQVTLPTGKSYIVSDCEEMTDIYLNYLQGDMWDNVVISPPKSHITPDDARCVMGSQAAYTSETCPVCRRVYSGADISRHLHTHTHEDRQDAHMVTLLTQAHTEAYVAQGATRVMGCYTSESEGLTDTTELSDAHVREDGKHLTCEVVVHPVGKCKCMHTDTQDNPLVVTRGIEGGNAYQCAHGTQWNEVWETSYTHARWDHLRDSHLQERSREYNAGQVGRNPLYSYLWRQKHTRTHRVAKMVTWIETAHLSAVLRTLNQGVLKSRRNRTVSGALGFDATPRGSWEGVSGSEICGLVRNYKTTLYGQVVMCTRIPDWSGVYLTKVELAYLTRLMEQRVGK